MDPEASQAQISLADIREEIDAVDAGLLQLLIRRFGLVEQVRASKATEGNDVIIPFRPSREVEVMRQLLETAGSRLPHRLVYRLWRSIMCAASLEQADVNLHVPSKVLGVKGFRDMLSEHFSGFTVVEHRTVAGFLGALAKSPADVAVVKPDQFDVVQFMKVTEGKAGVVSSLPFLTTEEQPELFVLAHSPAARTGDDETLVVTAGKLPREFVPLPLWDIETKGGHWISCLPGFLSDQETPLVGLKRNAGLELNVLGRYPSAMMIKEQV